MWSKDVNGMGVAQVKDWWLVLVYKILNLQFVALGFVVVVTVIIIIVVVIAETFLSMQQYVTGILLCWISAAVWATPPLLGWGRSLSVLNQFTTSIVLLLHWHQNNHIYKTQNCFIKLFSLCSCFDSFKRMLSMINNHKLRMLSFWQYTVQK